MRSMRVVIFLLLFAIPGAAQISQRATMRGNVSREDGRSIRDAFVLVHDNSAGAPEYVSQNWQMRTKDDGEFSFTIEPGCYDIFVSATLFFPFSQRLCVDERTPALKIKLKADPHPHLRID